MFYVIVIYIWGLYLNFKMRVFQNRWKRVCISISVSGSVSSFLYIMYIHTLNLLEFPFLRTLRRKKAGEMKGLTYISLYIWWTKKKFSLYHKQTYFLLPAVDLLVELLLSLPLFTFRCSFERKNRIVSRSVNELEQPGVFTCWNELLSAPSYTVTQIWIWRHKVFASGFYLSDDNLLYGAT